MLWFGGGPGCGRKTVCQRIVDLHPDYKYISVSQLLRDALELKSPQQFNWSDVKQAIDTGQLVDDVRHMSCNL